MRIGLVSDSHGNIELLKKAIDQMGNVEVVFHLGDYTEDALQIKQWTSAAVFIIKGNMDVYTNEGYLHVKTKIGGKTIFACHGHTADVKNGYTTIDYMAREKEADIVIFGHTHVPMIKNTDQLFMMNPGSVALPHIGEKKTFGILTIEDKKIDGEIIKLIE